MISPGRSTRSAPVDEKKIGSRLPRLSSRPLPSPGMAPPTYAADMIHALGALADIAGKNPTRLALLAVVARSFRDSLVTFERAEDIKQGVALFDGEFGVDGDREFGAAVAGGVDGYETEIRGE